MKSPCFRENETEARSETGFGSKVIRIEIKLWGNLKIDRRLIRKFVDVCDVFKHRRVIDVVDVVCLSVVSKPYSAR